MPVSTSTAVPLGPAPTYTTFRVFGWRVDTSGTQDVLYVDWQAANTLPDGSAAWQYTGPTQVYVGTKLQAMMGSAALQIQTAMAAGVPAAQAFYAAVKKTLYAQLQADGMIPSSAT